MSCEQVYRVGDVDDPTARVVRIVHVSDTHLMHDNLIDQNLIPDGDILVHSGDFDKYRFSRLISRHSDYLSEIAALNSFFSGLPHKTKIFVAGNHETNFPREHREQTASLLAPSCIYLQDASVTVNGIHFYGSPWNGLRHNSCARSFAVSYSSLPTHWRQIPSDTDVLVTHSPAYGVADLGCNKHLFNTTRYCRLCQEYHHKVFMHFGCPTLLDEILHRIRPSAHLFGHAHEPNGVQLVEGVLFSNAAMTCHKSANVVDFYVGSGRQKRTDDTQPRYTAEENSQCLVM